MVGLLFGNANSGVGVASVAMTGTGRIDNYDDYITNHSEATNFSYAAKNPGSWANNMKVCFIDNAGDQIIGVTTDSPLTAGMVVGHGVTTAITNATIPGDGTTSTFTGYLKGIITGVSTDATGKSSTIDVKILSRVSYAGTETKIDYAEGDPNKSFAVGNTLHFVNNSGINTGGGGPTGRTEPVDNTN